MTWKFGRIDGQKPNAFVPATQGIAIHNPADGRGEDVLDGARDSRSSECEASTEPATMTAANAAIVPNRARLADPERPFRLHSLA